MRKLPDHQLQLARQFRAQETETEALLWEHLRAKRLAEAKFRRQRPLGRYIADFCCDGARLVVEIDGGIHTRADQQAYDQIRDEMMKAWGYTVLRITTEEIANDLLATLTRISTALHPTSP